MWIGPTHFLKVVLSSRHDVKTNELECLRVKFLQDGFHWEGCSVVNDEGRVAGHDLLRAARLEADGQLEPLSLSLHVEDLSAAEHRMGDDPPDCIIVPPRASSAAPPASAARIPRSRSMTCAEALAARAASGSCSGGAARAGCAPGVRIERTSRVVARAPPQQQIGR